MAFPGKWIDHRSYFYSKIPLYHRSLWNTESRPYFILVGEGWFLVRKLGQINYSIKVIKIWLKFSSVKVICRLLDYYIVIYACLFFMSIMLGMFIYYYVVLGFADYTLCLCVLIMTLPY